MDPIHVEIQRAIFNQVAKELTERFPKELTIDLINPLVITDLCKLQAEERLIWDAGMKSSAWMKSEEYLNCPFDFVVYYGDNSSQYSCVGYVIGSYVKERSSFEVTFFEKRNDCDSDLREQFLGIVFSALSAYGIFLREKLNYPVEQLVLINPQAKKYFASKGFELRSNYADQGSEGMVRSFA